MDVSCFVRLSMLSAVYADVVRRAITTSLAFETTPVSIDGAGDTFVSGVVLQGATLFDESTISNESRIGGLRVLADLPMRMDFVVYVSSGITGNLARTIAIGVRLIFAVSMSQPVPSDEPRAPTVLLLKGVPLPDRRVVEVPGRGMVAWETVFGSDPVPWLQAVEREVAKIQVGALAPPVSAANVFTFAGTLAVNRFRNAARLVGDEAHFASIFDFNVPAALIFGSVAAFLSNGPQLSDGEDFAVELGSVATASAYYNIAAAVGQFLLNNTGTAFAGVRQQLGWSFGARPLFTQQIQTNVLADGTYRTELPFSLTGVCRGIDVAFPDVVMGLDFSLNARLSLTDAAGVVINALITIDADLDQDGVSRCFAQVLLIENWPALFAFGPGIAVADGEIENRIVKSLVRDSRALLQEQLNRVGATFSQVGDVDEAESILVTVPVRVGFDSFGTFPYLPQTIRSSRQGFSYRISGSVTPFAPSSSALNTLLVRAVVPYFPILFSRAIGQLDYCEEMIPSAVAFTLANNSPHAVTIGRIDVRSVDWDFLESVGSVRWTPQVSPGRRVVIPPWGALRVRCEFTSPEALNDAIEFSRSNGAFSELLVLVLSSAPPVYVRWDDPLRQLRDATPTDIEAARENCRRAPISPPFENLRRAGGLDLFSEIQPFWREDLSRVTPRDIQTQLPESSLPWEDSSQVTFIDDARLDAGPGVFAILMQSAARRR